MKKTIVAGVSWSEMNEDMRVLKETGNIAISWRYRRVFRAAKKLKATLESIVEFVGDDSVWLGEGVVKEIRKTIKDN